MRMHGTAVAVGGRGVVLRGPSGAGKSDLALRLLALPGEGYPALGIPPLEPLRLVADDYVELARDGSEIMLSVPETIRGKLEIRGLGIVTLPVAERAGLALVVDLAGPDGVERMPEAQVLPLLGTTVPLVAVRAFDVSAPLKILAALFHRIER